MSKSDIERKKASGSAWRTLAFIGVSAVCVYLFMRFGLVDAGRVRQAFSKHWDLLVLNVLCLLLLTVLSTIRHKWLLSAVHPVSWGAVTAANVVGFALGQWAPGSVAVAEIVRLGLLLGSSEAAPTREQVSQVTMISVIDRAIGIGVMFCCGAAAALLAILLYPSSLPVERFVVLAALSLSLGAVALWVPLYADAGPVQRLIVLLRSAKWGRAARVMNGAATALLSASSVSKKLRQRPHLLLACIFLTVLLNAFAPIAYYLTSLALDKPIPILLIAAILPTTIVAVIVPVGFAGFGGPQLVAMTNFAAFGIAAGPVLEMTLVQNALTLGVQTVLGLCWGTAYGAKVRALLQRGVEAAPDAGTGAS